MRGQEFENPGESDALPLPVKKFQQRTKKPSADSMLKRITPPAPTYESLSISFRKPQSKVPDNVKTPYELFDLFITSEHYEKLASRSNLFARSQRIKHSSENQDQARPWVNTISSEMKVFLGILLLMSVDRVPAMAGYWNTRKDKSIYCSIQGAMAERRFEQIKRYFRVSNHLEDLPSKSPH